MLVVSAALRSQLQGIGAVGKLGGDDEDYFRRIVLHKEVFRNLGDGATFRSQRDTYAWIPTHVLQLAALQSEGAACRGAGIRGTGRGIRYAADVHRCTFLTDNIDRGLLDGFAQVGTHVEVHHDGVLRCIPCGTFDDAAEAGTGVVQPGIDGITAHQQALHHALLQVVDVPDGFFAKAGVFGFHLGDDTRFVGSADGDGDKDHIFLVVNGHGVVRQLAVDLIMDFFCHCL